MRSIREIFLIGHGPSSSHTMGPAFACDYVVKKYQDDIKSIKVVLYGSLALTGKGHLTDYIIDLKLKTYPHEIVFDYETKTVHPNTMRFFITKNNNEEVMEEVLSIGGGSIITSDTDKVNLSSQNVYQENSLKEILAYCKKYSLSLEEYVLKFEGQDILEYLRKIYETFEECRSRGISKTGELPGELHVKRKARTMYMAMRRAKDGKTNIHMNMAISSFAVAEENASGGIVVIAPTCGSAGVIPGCITYLKMKNYDAEQIKRGLLVAGLIGILAKTNGSISGAEAGCQAEIGVACAMGAALVASTQGLSNENIAEAAEIAMEHSLGLTCDPVKGYVQIPCIERCAMYALKAVNAATLAKLIPADSSKISFDDSIATMLQTGKDLSSEYRETSLSGLAKLMK